MNKEEWDELHRMVGLVVVRWALIEQLLDMCIAIAYHHPDRIHGDAEIPVSLKKKVKFLRDAFEAAHLSSFKDDALRLLVRVSDMSDTRHDFVHGAIASVSEGAFEFSTFKVKDGMHHHRPFKFNKAAFPKLAKQLEALLVDVGNLTRELAIRVAKPKR